MRYKLLGKSGLKVSELCLGTMTFGENWGWGAPKDECRKIFESFVAAGGNFIDTANHYTNGTSERFVGEFVGADRDMFVIATKYTLNDRPADPNGGGNHRKSLVQSVDASLKRLNTDYIDLYWVHAWDSLTPIEEMMRALDDQVRLGKILYVGFSDAPAWVVARANTMADLMGWSPFIGIQVLYNLLERTAERELLPMARALDIGVTAWSPLAAGVLSGKYNREMSGPHRLTEQNPTRNAFVTERNLAIAQTVVDVAEKIGRTASQVSLNWILRQGARGVVIPILGARSLAQLKDNLGCLDFKLGEEELRRLDEASAVPMGFPNDFINIPMIRELVHGTTFGLLDNHRA